MNANDLLLGFGIALLGGMLTACGILPTPGASRAGMDALESLHYTAAATRVAAVRGGSAGSPRIIYVHGSPGEASGWADYLVNPIAGSESIAIDRPGYGRTRTRSSVPSLGEQARALEPLLVQRDGRWPILVGHSLGGPIVLQAATDFPGRVGGIVVIAGSVDPGLERLRWYNFLAKGLAWILPRDLTRSNEEMWDLRSELEQLRDKLGAVRCPIWIVHGSQDSLVPVANVEYLQLNLGRTHTTVFEDAGHFLIWQEPWKSHIRAILRLAFDGDG